ncbi:biofilm peroxide resistance protein BsmA [Affinibrenneria salicis]|uniref:Biofilm peroxide resistance protein BsmA n=1 Tax=Affinibrenneria salicis TaxID=2590031 RepID=A0A5J5FWM9_9GAMM|nr:biofilm peroxide resistance protein BsmA [Affinibrenneria salicis]KAA8997738.1 biofilm peroxide resistance protein BsmA [Affinibrenneria salicis]
MSRTLLLLSLSVLLTACSVFAPEPVAPPPPTRQAQLINQAQSRALEKIGTLSVRINGSPDDADRAVQQQADARGARYYVIVLKQESRLPGIWQSSAVLYR